MSSLFIQRTSDTQRFILQCTQSLNSLIPRAKSLNKGLKVNKNARKWPNFPRINSKLRIDSWTPQCQLSQTIVKWKYICFPKCSQHHRHGVHSPHRWLCEYIYKYNILVHNILQARFQRHSTSPPVTLCLENLAFSLFLIFFFFKSNRTWWPSPWVTQSSLDKLTIKWN